MQNTTRCPFLHGQVDRLCPRLTMVVGRICQGAGVPHCLAEDCELEALLKLALLAGRPPTVAPEKRCAYCERTVTRAVLRFLLPELERRRRTVPLDPDVDWGTPDAADAGLDLPAEGTTLLEQIGDEALALAVRRLAPAEYDALDLVYGRRMTASQAAAQLGIPEAAVRQRLSRGLSRLRVILGQRRTVGAHTPGTHPQRVPLGDAQARPSAPPGGGW